MVPQKKITCAVCGETFWGYKNRKYCSEECYNEAHRKQARERFRIRYTTHREEECARSRDYCRRNREKKQKHFNDWYARHRTEYCALLSQRRRAAKEAPDNA